MIRFNLLGSWSRVTLDRSDFLTATPADLRIRDFRKILLIKLSAVGDVVHTIPVLNKLRRRYPDAQIDWLVSSTIAEFLDPHPAITNVIEFVREDWAKPLAACVIGKFGAPCRPVARREIRSRRRPARSVAQRLARPGDRGAGADRFRQTDRAPVGRAFAQAAGRSTQACLAGRPRGKLASLLQRYSPALA